MPLVVDCCFYGKRGRAEEATVAAAEAVTVNVGKVFVAVLLAHGHAFLDLEVVVGVPAVRPAVRETGEVDCCCVAPGFNPVCESDGG